MKLPISKSKPIMPLKLIFAPMIRLMNRIIILNAVHILSSVPCMFSHFSKGTNKKMYINIHAATNHFDLLLCFNAVTSLASLSVFLNPTFFSISHPPLVHFLSLFYTSLVRGIISCIQIFGYRYSKYICFCINLYFLNKCSSLLWQRPMMYWKNKTNYVCIYCTYF